MAAVAADQTEVSEDPARAAPHLPAVMPVPSVLRRLVTAPQQTWDVLARALLSNLAPPDRGCRLIRDGNYAVLYIFTHNPNTYRPDEIRHTRHEFVVPVATYHWAAWIRWVFDRVASIEMHETAECFEVDGVRVYAPHHGNGWDPYTLWYDGHPAEQAKAPGDD